MPRKIIKDNSSEDDSTEIDDNNFTVETLHATPERKNKTEVITQRSSERIRSRRNRSFEMPTRSKVLSGVATMKSPGKSFSALKPRRIVNDFMKETHRYNHDPNASGGESESSIEDFIDDDDDEEQIDDSENSDNGSSNNVSVDEDGNDSKSEKEEDVHSSDKSNTNEADENVSFSRKPKAKRQILQSDSSSEEDESLLIASNKKASPRQADRKRRITDASSGESEHSDQSSELSGTFDDIPYIRNVGYQFIPCTAAQIFKMDTSSHQRLLSEKPVNRITLVGVVRRIEKMSLTHTVYYIDDMTDRLLEVHHYIDDLDNSSDSPVKMENEGLHWKPSLEKSTPAAVTDNVETNPCGKHLEATYSNNTMRQSEKLNNIKINTYIRIFGRVNTSDSIGKHIKAYNIRQLTDANEITTHMLEVLKMRVNNPLLEASRTVSNLLPFSADDLEENITSESESTIELSDANSGTISSISESSDIEDGRKRPSKRARHMRRKRGKELKKFTQLKQLREEKKKHPSTSNN